MYRSTYCTFASQAQVPEFAGETETLEIFRCDTDVAAVTGLSHPMVTKVLYASVRDH